MDKQFYIYILANKNNSALYTGVTSDIKRRIFEHKNQLVEGFTKRYRIEKLVYYEVFRDIENAIVREKQIKAGSRNDKIRLIDGFNGQWRDLYEEL